MTTVSSFFNEGSAQTRESDLLIHSISERNIAHPGIIV